jgi:hypothetical protein
MHAVGVDGMLVVDDGEEGLGRDDAAHGVAD